MMPSGLILLQFMAFDSWSGAVQLFDRTAEPL
jgi:hypothetical protein